MTLSVRQYTPETAAQIPANANAIRQRLMNPPRSKAAPEAVVVLRIVEDLPEWPLWRRTRISFDHHVTAYRAWQWKEAEGATSVAFYLRKRCRELSLSYSKVIGRSRSRYLIGPRHLLIWEVKKQFNLSLPKIGRHFGGRDHTSILHALRKIEAMKARGEI